MADPISVAVRRGGVVEAVHRVHAVAVRADGELVAAAGDPRLMAFYRSSAKPLQALLPAAARPDLDTRELAIASASHQAESAQLDAVRKLLRRAGAATGDLENGTQDGRPEGALGHNCSGKHAGMLAACRAHGWPLHPYRDRAHPLQRRIAELVGPAEVATDGCGVPTFALPLSAMASAFGRLAAGELEGSDRITAAMVAKPELVEGPGRTATEVMKALPGTVAKGGAEGLLCVGFRDGVGFAFKAEDGASRPLGPAAASVLGCAELAETPIENSRGDVVGRVRVDG
jgi:L-asparaginase II